MLPRLHQALQSEAYRDTPGRYRDCGYRALTHGGALSIRCHCGNDWANGSDNLWDNGWDNRRDTDRDNAWGNCCVTRRYLTRSPGAHR